MIEQVKIGGIRYPVKIVDDLHDKHTELYGWIKYDKHEIYISSDLGEQGRYQVLWHEVVHGILKNAGITDENEILVEAISHGIMQVLVDNPGIEQLPK